MLEKLKDRHLLALYRGGWKRCGVALRHPRMVMAIRAEAERRGLL